MQNGQAIAKVQGPQPSLNSPPVSWYVGLAYSGSYILKVTTDGTGSYYKSIAFNSSDTTKAVGSAWGAKTSCDTVVVNPTCVIDTMGDETSCKDLGTWQKYASSTCAERGMILNWINPLVPCTSSLEKAYKWVCFECCNAMRVKAPDRNIRRFFIFSGQRERPAR
jgi:hypothetical protein